MTTINMFYVVKFGAFGTTLVLSYGKEAVTVITKVFKRFRISWSIFTCVIQ